MINTGYRVTHVISSADGNVIDSCIHHIPLARIPCQPRIRWKRPRECRICTYSYVCPDLAKEFAEYDTKPDELLRL